ncbi:hypothetical protein [Shewanella surugensis]|uniref:Uncharacterized protein n=1 Tax=Shewanella surugensis TaxID=212020 RepID=A0ABT0LA45_9GAMM|nr:hypothetical protein [Shewanella surugensis]MCL1124556.1 hypothetical protein [Shewanella surugensis]
MNELTYFKIAVNCFFYDPDDPDENWEEGYASPMDRPDVKNLYSRFDIVAGEYLYIDKNELKLQIIQAYTCDDAFWISLNQDVQGKEYEDGHGFACIGLEIWDQVYPEVTPYLNYDIEKYHPEMLKLLVKRLIWDLVFTGETLPNYTEPTDGWLPYIEHLKPK